MKKSFKNQMSEELKSIDDLFKLGMLTPHERFAKDHAIKSHYAMIKRLTTNGKGGNW